MALSELFEYVQRQEYSTSKIFYFLETIPPSDEETKAFQDTRSTILTLDGKSRLSIPLEQPIGDLISETPGNTFSRLFRNNELRERVRRVVFDAFGKYLVIDPTKGGSLRIRLSSRPPYSEDEEKGLTTAAINFHREAVSLEVMSDGVRAFIGIITVLMADAPRACGQLPEPIQGSE